MKTILTILIGLLISQSLVCQTEKKTYLKLARDLYNENKRDSALYYANLAIELYKDKRDSLAQSHRIRAKIYSVMKTPQEALKEIRVASEMARSEFDKNDVNLVKILRDHARIAHQAMNFDEAKSIFSEAINAVDPQNDSLLLIPQIMTNRAWMHLVKREFEEGIPMAEEAFRLYTEKLDSLDDDLTHIYQTLGSLYQYSSRYKESIPYLEKFLKIVQLNNPPDHPNIGIAHNDMASPYQNLGDYKMAMYHRRKCEENLYLDHLKTGQGRYLSVAIGNLGYLYSVMGEHALALEYLVKSLSLNEKDYGENSPTLILPLCQLADAYNGLNQPDIGLPYLERAMKIQMDHDRKDQAGITYINNNLITTYRIKGEFDKALKLSIEAHNYYKRADEIYTKLGNASVENLKMCYLGLKDYKKALAYAQMDNLIIDSLVGRIHYASLIKTNQMVDIYLEMGEIKKAQDVLEKHLMDLDLIDNDTFSIKEIIPLKSVLKSTILTLKIFKERHRNGENVIDEFMAFMTDFESYYPKHIAAYRSSSSIQSDGEELNDIYGLAIDFLYSLNDKSVFPQIITFSEKYKSLLLRIMTSNNLISQNFKDKKIANRNQYLLDKLELARAKIIESKKEDTDAYIKLTGLQEDYIAFQDSLYVIDPDYQKSRVGFENITLNSLSATLEKDEILIEYMIRDSSIYIITLDKQQNISIEKKAINHLEEKIRKVNAFEFATEKTQLRKDLFQLLIPKTMFDKPRALIIPDDILFYLNFETLINSDNQYVIEHKTIRYGYSASLMSLQNNLSKKRTNQILSLTPGFSDEMKDYYSTNDMIHPEDTLYLSLLKQPFMTKMLSGFDVYRSSNSFAGIDATEEAFTEVTSGCKILHLGTHGDINDASPMFSRLILAKDSVNDGYLYAYEIYSQEIDADLAVLSACQTGKGKVAKGEGVLSLSYAFTYAGCPSVVMSLWSIDEKTTSEILESFYVNLSNGQAKSEALRNAKLNYLTNAKRGEKDPYYWGGLVLLGDDSPVKLTKKGSHTIWFTAAAILFILLGGGYLIRRRIRRMAA